MDTLSSSIEKLNALLTSGLINQKEFDERRLALVNKFVGLDGSVRAAPTRPLLAPTRRPLPLGRSIPVRSRGYGPIPAFRGAYGSGYAPYARPRQVGPAPQREVLGQWGTAIKVQPIPDGVDEQQLAEAFAEFGDITSVAIHRGSPPYGHVNFQTREAAAAVAALDRFDWGGQVCFVTLRKRAWASTLEGPPTNGIGIFNLPLEMTEPELSTLLSVYPGLTNIKMVYNKVTAKGRGGDFRGYAFAYFDTVENATAARDGLSGQPYGEAILDVKYSNRPADQAISSSLGQFPY